MYSYIIIHHTHENIQVALFLNNTLHSSITQEKRLVSKMLITDINNLLEKHGITLTDLSFIGINQGPGLFSTLRSIIATVNGLHFATNIPLIGVDALEATAHEYYNADYPYTVVLLDAFNQEVYYAIAHNIAYLTKITRRARPEPVEGFERSVLQQVQDELILEFKSGNINGLCYNKVISKGYKNITAFLHQIKKDLPAEKIYFVGRGVELYKDLIVNICGDQAVIPNIIPDICALDAIAHKSLITFQHNQKGCGYLYPLHLKKHPVELL